MIKKQINKKSLRKKLPIKWEVPEGLIKQFADHITIQHDESTFTLSFYQLKPPIIIEEDEGYESEMKELTSIRAKCIAQVVISSSKLPGLINALQVNWYRQVKFLEEIKALK